MNGLILFAHGARDPNWALPFAAVAARVQVLRPDATVRLAFLEFMAPDLPGAAADLAASGCQRIEVLPLFLGAGGHVRRDLPSLLERLRGEYPEVSFTLHRAAGEHPALIECLAAVAASTLPA
jgi:sirohydrochlorin cobaltochelatase